MNIKIFGCITYYKNFDQNKGKFQPNASKGIFLGFNEETNSNLIMDYEDYKLHYVREILAFEDEPANISLSNSATDKEYNVYFFKFDFNFSKFENLRDHFFINNSNENFQILDNSLPENNSNLNDLTNNNALTKNTLLNKDFNNVQNDTNVNNISNETNLELNDEDYFSAEENEFESISDQNEKILIIKIHQILIQKIQNNKNNNDLSSNSQNCIAQNNNNLNLNEYQNIQNNNNLSSEKFNFLNQNKINYNNLDSKNLNSNNINNINDNINNNLDYHKNFSSNVNISNNNNGKTLIDTVSSDDMDIDIDYNTNFNIFSNYNQYMSNISNNLNNNILNKLNLNSNSKLNTIDSNNNIFENQKAEKEGINNKSVNNNVLNYSKGHKNLIINNKFKVPQEYSVIRDALQRYKFFVPNKNPFDKPKKNNNNNNRYITNVVTNIPFTYNDAINSDVSDEWQTAINDELNNLYENNIFYFVKKIPNNKNVISLRWVFNNKLDSNNNIIKRKARVVAKVFKQKRGIDFDLTYSPTLNIDALKLIIALAAKFSWPILQLDIKAAYLHADLEIYILLFLLEILTLGRDIGN